MKALLAIIKLTVRNAFRSHIFQLLLLLLLLCVVFIPATVGGGTAEDFIRVSLLYSLWAVGAVLSLSSIWLGCYIMASDVDNYQLHMVVSKPVSRLKIWFGKWIGVNILNLVLLFFAGTAIYFIIIYRFNRQEFSPAERQKIRNEVMVGRRVFWPIRSNYDIQSRELVKKRLERLQQQGKSVKLSVSEHEKMLNDARLEVVSAESEVRHQAQPRVWRFPYLPKDLKNPIFLRYRPYVGKVSSEGQRMTRVWWMVFLPRPKQENNNVNVFKQGEARDVFDPFVLTERPQQVMSGEFHEMQISPKAVTSDNMVLVGVTNYDDGGSSQFYQPADGPKLLIEVCGFFSNYLRSIGVIAMQLLLLSGLACAFGGFLTMPTAIFLVVSYLLFGSFSVYLTDQSYFVSGAADHIGQFIAKLLLLVVIPIQAFEVTGAVASGELIEWGFMWKLFWYYFICRGLPLFFLGMYLYNRRELGLVIRK